MQAEKDEVGANIEPQAERQVGEAGEGVGVHIFGSMLYVCFAVHKQVDPIDLLL